MPARKATASGKWSQSIWDVTPSVGDDVFANGFTVEIDQDINVGSLRTTVSGVYAAAGGGFTTYNPLNVTVSPRGLIAGTTTCLTNYLTGYRTVTITGSVSGGGSAAAYGINNSSTGMVTVVGSVSSGLNATAYGVFNNSAGIVSIVGDVFGVNTSTAPAVFQNSTGTLIINGTINASISASGVVASSTAARNEFTGPFVNASNGRQAVYCARYLVTPQKTGTYTQMAGPSGGPASVTFYDVSNYSVSQQPPVSSVAVGTTYAAWSLSGIPAQLSGTMVVPSANSVSYGTPVGNTTGTAILNNNDLLRVWETNTNTLTAEGTIGKRLANSATISDLGQTLTTINL